MSKQQQYYIERLRYLRYLESEAKKEGNQEKLKELAWSIAWVSDALYLD